MNHILLLLSCADLLVVYLVKQPLTCKFLARTWQLMSKYSDVHLQESPGQQISNPGRVHPPKAKLPLTAVFTGLVCLLGSVENEPDYPAALGTLKRFSYQTPPSHPRFLCFRCLG